METTEEDCVRALRAAAGRLGESPTKAQYEDLGLRPASATILRVMGGWNAAKEAAGLETYASSGSRVGPKPADVDLSGDETWGELSVDQRWHYRNVDWNTERTQRRRRRLRDWVRDRKAERGCVNCGEDDPACLELHHRGQKRMNVSRMVTYGYGKPALRREIDSCAVLCTNCHRIEHHEPPGGLESIRTDPTDAACLPEYGLETRSFPDDRDRRRAWVHEFKRLRGCTRCDETTAACLDLHHRPDVDKRLSVSELVSRGRPTEQVLAEIDKCIVLCANCHRKTHSEGTTDDTTATERTGDRESD